MNNNNRTYNDEREVDLLALLVEVLTKIKTVLIFAIIFAVLLGGLSVFKGLRARVAANAQIARGEGTVISEEARLQYESELKAYEDLIDAYKADIKSIEDDIKDAENEAKESYILSTEVADYFKESIIYYIDAHYTFNANAGMQPMNPAGSIIQAYRSLTLNDAFYSRVKTALGEGVELSDVKSLIQLDTDESRGFLQLSVCAKTKADADKLYKLAKDSIESNYNKVNSTIAAHDLKVVETFGITGEGMKGATMGVTAVWDSYNAKINEFNKSIDGIKKSMKSEKKPEEPEGTEVSRVGLTAIARSAIKKGILGAFVGAFLAAMYIAVMFIIKDNALSEDEIIRRYGLNVLASLKRFSGNGRWNKFLAKISGDDRRVDSVENAARLAAINTESILTTLGNTDKEVLLVGHDNEMLDRLSSLMPGVKAVSGGNIMVDTDAVSKLGEFENVVIAEAKNSVSYTEIGREYDKLRVLNKNVIGVIAL